MHEGFSVYRELQYWAEVLCGSQCSTFETVGSMGLADGYVHEYVATFVVLLLMRIWRQQSVQESKTL